MNLLTLESVLTQLVAWVKSLFVQPDYAQNDSTQPDYIKNRTHYVENVSTSSVWNQTGCNVGSGTTSPGGYPATFNITTGDKYNVTISQGSTSKTYEGLTAEYDSVFNGLALRKNWSNSMGMSDTSTDALLLVVQPSNVVLRSADIYGENCTVQVSEVTETVHKLDPKYLPDNVNQLESITTQESSVSGGTNVVTFTQTNGTQTSFNVKNGEKGETGATGATGPQGATGPIGPQGPKGDDGVSLGEVALVQQLSQDDDKVPSAKAVQDGIEVWRDSISYLYSANDLNFDGTNYVNTEWNPYSTDCDFEIRMQISDLLLDSMSNSDTIISCIKQVSPYPGFSISRVSATKLQVYINGSARILTTVNKGIGSVNTIIFKRVGNVYTFTVNETSTSYTYPSNGVDNSGANTLHIGASLDANDAPFRYGKFKLDYIRVATNASGFEHDVQLYGDYKKHDKIYPKVSVDGIRIPEYFSGRWVEFELNDYPSRNLNPLSADGITLVYDYRYVGGNPSMGTLFQFIGVTTTQDQLTIGTAAHQFRLTIAKNGTTQSVVLNNTGISTLACLIIVTMDFVNGVCKFYRNGDFFVSKTFDTTLLPESSNIKRVIVETENSGDLTYRTKKFMTVINGCLDGDTIQKMWDSYPLDIYPSSLCTYEFSKHTDVDMSNISAMGQGSGVQTSDKTVSSVVCSGEYATNMHIYKSSLFGSYEMSHYCKYYGKIKVTEGTITFTGLGIRGSVKINVYNATDDTWLGNNSVILPIGEYYFNGDAILNDSANIFRFTSSSSFSFIFSNFKMERIGAVLNLSPYTYFNNTFELFGGEKIPVGSNFVKYFDTYKIPITYSESNPSYSGQLKMADDNVYVGYIKGGTATWKQINNS